MKAKKLIEVALPIKEISAESVRDKHLSHTPGHIATLHVWWARRPLPTCRAVVFASVVPDPLDENCPKAFCDAIDFLLNSGESRDIYRPYLDIPYTAVIDPMEDNRRNRLMMFIGKFSETCQDNMKKNISTPLKNQISDFSLIKWENRNCEGILEKARLLIWTAYNAEQNPNISFNECLTEFHKAYDAIKEAECELYNEKNRHLCSDVIKKKELHLKNAIEAFQEKMPIILDPFAGGATIPMEAARLGCRSFGNDINPVAHILERCSAEFPQRFGKPLVISGSEIKRIYGNAGFELVPFLVENPVLQLV